MNYDHVGNVLTLEFTFETTNLQIDGNVCDIDRFGNVDIEWIEGCFENSIFFIWVSTTGSAFSSSLPRACFFQYYGLSLSPVVGE